MGDLLSLDKHLCTAHQVLASGHVLIGDDAAGGSGLVSVGVAGLGLDRRRLLVANLDLARSGRTFDGRALRGIRIWNGHGTAGGGSLANVGKGDARAAAVGGCRKNHECGSPFMDTILAHPLLGRTFLGALA